MSRYCFKDNKKCEEPEYGNRKECGYSFLPYRVLTKYMTANAQTTHFHIFKIDDIKCTEKGKVKENYDLAVDMQFKQRDFTVLQNDVVYSQFNKVQFNQANEEKVEL